MQSGDFTHITGFKALLCVCRNFIRGNGRKEREPDDMEMGSFGKQTSGPTETLLFFISCCCGNFICSSLRYWQQSRAGWAPRALIPPAGFILPHASFFSCCFLLWLNGPRALALLWAHSCPWSESQRGSL